MDSVLRGNKFVQMAANEENEESLKQKQKLNKEEGKEPMFQLENDIMNKAMEQIVDANENQEIPPPHKKQKTEKNKEEEKEDDIAYSQMNSEYMRVVLKGLGFTPSNIERIADFWQSLITNDNFRMDAYETLFYKDKPLGNMQGIFMALYPIKTNRERLLKKIREACEIEKIKLPRINQGRKTVTKEKEEKNKEK